jgi:hypothetical protein
MKTESTTEDYKRTKFKKDIISILNEQGSQIGRDDWGHSCGSTISMDEYSQYQDYVLAKVDVHSWESGLCGTYHTSAEQLFRVHVPSRKTDKVQRIEYRGEPKGIMHARDLEQYPTQQVIKYSIGENELQVRYSLAKNEN